MKVLVSTLLLISTMAFANEYRPHTGELLYQLKGEKARIAPIRVYRPKSKSLTNDLTNHLSKIRKQMLNSGRYEFVEFNTIETLPKVNSSLDPDLSKQWQHEKIETLPAWDYTQGSSKVIVAVCDSGVESTHEDLAQSVLEKGYDFIDGDTIAQAATSHGTFVAGLIAAAAGNNLGGSGVAPQVKILPLRIANTSGSTSMKLINDCIRYAADQGAKVINVSFTGVENLSIESSGAYARSKGSLLVYSAGNQGRNRYSYPDHKNVVIVGATNSYDQRWTYGRWFWGGGSNYGPFIDIVAPGHNVYSTVPGNTYRSGSGTSFSAPILSGVAALVFSINPNLSPEEVEEILYRSADKLGSDYYYGAGRVNAKVAVQLASDTLKN
jgi:thermitase